MKTNQQTPIVRRRTPCFVIVAVWLACLAAAHAAPYAFINIVDSAGEFAGFNPPSINQGGTVAFVARRDANDRVLYTWRSGVFSPLLFSSNEPFSNFSGVETPINDSGRVAFVGGLDTGGDGIYTTDGLTTVTIARGTNPFAAFSLIRPVSINAAGTVAFQAGLSAGGQAIAAGSGGGQAGVLYSHADPEFLGFGGRVPINDSGTVAFGAGLDAGGSGIFTGNGGPASPIVLGSGPGDYNNGLYAMNQAGMAVFYGPGLTLLIGNASGTNVIFSGSTSAASINNANRVAFLANATTSAEALWIGSVAGTQRILRRGDSLFGSTITQLRLGSTALNDAGQLAFAYTLANGRNGIALAQPPLIRITSISRSLNETIHLEISGLSNAVHHVQATPSLGQQFTSISTNTAAANGKFSFDDTNAPAFQRRFYRVALP